MNATKNPAAGLLKKIEKWEAAWAEYVEAEENLDQCRPLRFVRGHRNAWRSAKARSKNAQGRLRKLDPEFCDRMGI